MRSFTVVVNAAPVAKARPRVAVRAGRAHAYTPNKTQHAEWQIREAFIAKYPEWTPMTGALSVEIVAVLPIPKSIPARRRNTAWPTKRPDLDNYIKILDSLDGVAWVDDSQIVRLAADKRYAREGESPRWIIAVAEIDPA